MVSCQPGAHRARLFASYSDPTTTMSQESLYSTIIGETLGQSVIRPIPIAKYVCVWTLLYDRMSHGTWSDRGTPEVV